MARLSSAGYGSPLVSETAVHAVTAWADHAAGLAVEVLREMGLVPNRESSRATFPPGFLLEFAAIAQLGAWEMHGSNHHIDVGLPSFDEAAADFHRRVQADPRAFDSCESATIHQRVLRYRLDHTAWDGVTILGAEFTLDTSEEEALLDAMARLLWDRRHELARFLSEEESDRP